jgi:hypothetical protein
MSDETFISKEISFSKSSFKIQTSRAISVYPTAMIKKIELIGETIFVYFDKEEYVSLTVNGEASAIATFDHMRRVMLDKQDPASL